MSQRIQTPVPGQLLQEAFGLVGRVAPHLEEVVIPTISLGDLSEGQAPPIIRRAGVSFFIAAVAGELATWSFEVPGSVLAVMRRIWFQGATASRCTARFRSSINTAAFTIATSGYADGRLARSLEEPAGHALFGTQVAALVAPVWRQDFSVASPGTSQTLDWIIGSGNPSDFGFLEMQGAIVNDAVRVTLEWDEFQVV